MKIKKVTERFTYSKWEAKKEERVEEENIILWKRRKGDVREK